MNPLERLHARVVLERRMTVLAGRLAALVPTDADVLDVGAGSGALASALLARRPDLSLTGVDVLVRADSSIPVQQFDGATLPFDTDAVEVALLVDVLHHADDPTALLAECARVARRVVVKDHLADGFLARPTLRFMDRVGNRRHGVALTYGYRTTHEWQESIARAGLTVETWETKLRLYPWPASLVFDRSLHFLASLRSG